MTNRIDGHPPKSPSGSLRQDISASIVVFLLALPLCMGIALASGAEAFSGLLAGIIGGIVVGAISGSQTSVSGPAAGLTAIIAAQIIALGSFHTFLLAVFIAGLIQIGLGLARAGALSAFVPSSVVKGLLAAIGVLLILKQFPHVFGHDESFEGEMSFTFAAGNTFSEIMAVFSGDVHFGAAVIGIVSILLLVLWERVKLLKESVVPGPLVVVVVGVLLQSFLRQFGGPWEIEASHLVEIPVPETLSGLIGFLQVPDFSQWTNPAVYVSAVTIALVASLESLLNLEAVDKLDPQRRDSPPSRELVAQGVGNTLAGLIGAIPVTLVVVRSSVNVAVGARSKRSTILHGILLLVCVAFLPSWLNMIPLSALAAILFVTGFKLASPSLFQQMFREGRYQFVPFMVTLLAIVFSDLLTGILVGLATSILFILNSNLRRPVRRIIETHIGGDVLHVELANQVTFLNRASLDKLFREAAPGSSILLDARDTDYIDPDVMSLILEFKKYKGPAKNVSVSMRGFRDKYDIDDEIQFADYSTRELQDRVAPEQVLELLREGNQRFQLGTRLTRDFARQIGATAKGQTPLAAVLSCIDSRVPAELVFDLGIGDIFSVRVAGNVIGSKSLGSIEYAVGVAGVKLVLVLGHTRCGAVTSSVKLLGDNKNVEEATGCQHLHTIVDEIAPCIENAEFAKFKAMDSTAQESFVDDVAKRNVLRTVHEITTRSNRIGEAVREGKVLVVGALYDVNSGAIDFYPTEIKPSHPE